MNSIQAELKKPIAADVVGEKQPTSAEFNITKVLRSSFTRRQSEASSDNEGSGGSLGNKSSGSSKSGTGCDDSPEPRKLASLPSTRIPLGGLSSPSGSEQRKRKTFKELARGKSFVSFSFDSPMVSTKLNGTGRAKGETFPNKLSSSRLRQRNGPQG